MGRSPEMRRIRHGGQYVRACLGIVVTVTSAACTPSPDPPHRTVEYYRDHAAEREAKLAECINDPGALGKTPDCVNARVAGRQVGIGSLRGLPPLGLPSESAGSNAQPGDPASSDHSNAESDR